MITSDITIQNKLGLHARASAKFVMEASKFPCVIMIRMGDYEVNGKSIMGMMMLAAAQGTSITLIAEGAQENQAIKALKTLINNRFGEEA